MRGLNAAQAIASAYQHGPEAARGGAIVQQALGGTDQHDISLLVRGVERTTAALNVHEQQLGELIGHFNTFLGSIAAQSSSVSAAVAELPGTLHTANVALVALHRSFPALRSFSLALIPGVEQTPATVHAALPWIEQFRGLLAPRELGGVAAGLQSRRAGARLAGWRSAGILQAGKSGGWVREQGSAPRLRDEAPGRREHLGREQRTGVPRRTARTSTRAGRASTATAASSGCW